MISDSFSPKPETSLSYFMASMTASWTPLLRAAGSCALQMYWWLISRAVTRIVISVNRLLRTLLAEIGPRDRTGLFGFDPYTISRDGAQYAYRYWKRLSTLFVVTPSP
jgi:hypothetical protein